jgi:hypothetical protein
MAISRRAFVGAPAAFAHANARRVDALARRRSRSATKAAKGGKPGGANFEFGALVTESLLAGNVALRTREKLDWDGKNLKVTNVAAANDLLHRPYREGWTL